MDLIKVLLVIDVRLIGNIFTSVLEEQADIEVAGCAATLQDAFEFIQSKEVDIILVSAELPDHGALEITHMILDRGCCTKVLVLGLSGENQTEAIRYIEAGACGYVLKDSSVHDLIEAIRLAQKGEAQISGRIAVAVMERLVHFARMFSAVKNKIEGDVRLTSRELEILQFVGEGLTNQEIAARLVVEVGTVKNHVHSILEKLNVSNRDEAASYLAFIKK